jgi:hypothetical protein
MLIHSHFQAGNQRGSFLSRNTATLNRLAVMTKSKNEGRAGSGAKNTSNFVFARIEPKTTVEPVDREAVEISEEQPQKKRKTAAAASGPAKKKPKVDRKLDENSRDSIFGFM